MVMMTPEKIRRLRAWLDMTTTEFGALVGVSANTISRWEAGDRHPNYERMKDLNDLADERGVDLDKDPPPNGKSKPNGKKLATA